jgi:hypothetical protein
LTGIQLPEKYKENFDVSSEGPSSGSYTLFWLNPFDWFIILIIIYLIIFPMCTYYPYYTSVSFHVHMFPRNLVALCKYCNYHKLLLRFYLANPPFNLYTYYLITSNRTKNSDIYRSYNARDLGLTQERERPPLFQLKLNISTICIMYIV